MRGELVKKEGEWYIKDNLDTYYPLHPDDVEQIKKDALIFDDIEARIKAWPNTSFKIYEVWEQIDGETKVTRYGKVKSVIEENEERLQSLKSTYLEISDEEIKKAANEYADVYQCPSEVSMCKHDIISAWNNAIKWYREQLKKRNEKR